MSYPSPLRDPCAGPPEIACRTLRQVKSSRPTSRHSSLCIPVESPLATRPVRYPDVFGFAASATPMPIRKTNSPPRKPLSEARPTPEKERTMGKTPGSPGAPERSNQLNANSATMKTLLSPWADPINLRTRTGRYPEPVDQAEHRREEPPYNPDGYLSKRRSLPI